MLPFFLTFLLLATRVVAQVGPTNWTASPFNPPSLPLAVKSPYVNTWAPLGNRSAAVSTAWPREWDALLEILGWYGSVRVDGTTYEVLGAQGDPISVPASQESFVFTPTQSFYTLKAGPVNVNMSFLSPIEATDLVRQSMPFSYMYITVESNDGNSHAVQVYSDLSGEWISGNSGLNSNWTINESTNFVYLQMGLTSPGPYQEISNRPQDATLYHCMKTTDQVSWQIGPAGDIRTLFANGTGLDKTSESGTHPVNNPFNTLGISYDLGNVTSTSSKVVFALGVVRDPVIQYTNREVQTEERRAYYWSNFSNIHDVIEDVLDHFDDALAASTSLDSQILGDAGQISSNYADLLSLSTRQAMGALEYTLLESNGEFNTSDVKAFMKDMGSVGSGGVNAVDVMYAAMPVYLYLNPAILGYLLSPLMEYQESTQYQNPYAAEDIGTAFPNATGNYQGHDQKIEQSANMLIMSLAHAQASGDGSLLAQHYDLLSRWATYLVNNTMAPDDQTTSISDAISSTNQTNLVLKGILGIGAMAKISQYTGHSDDQSHFSGIVGQYSQQWTNLASASDQLVLNFGSSSSGIIYNLYADKLLQLNLLNSSVYDRQTAFYGEQASMWKYGIPLDSSNSSSHSRSDWMMFAAASVTNTSVRDAMISQVHAYASPNLENLPFAVLYNPSTGSQAGGENSPAQGAMFAPLALNVTIKSVTFSGASTGASPVSSPGPKSHTSNVGVIAGATAGGIVFVVIVIGALMFCCRRRESQPTSIYNRTDRIERIKPATYPSDSVLEPLSSTIHPGMHDLRNLPYKQQAGDSTIFPGVNAAPYSAITPYPMRSIPLGATIGVSGSAASSAVLLRNGSSAFGGSSGSESVWGAQVATPSDQDLSKSGVHHEELRSEVDNLRREIERMRDERSRLGEAPPSYEEELAVAMRSPTSS